MFRLKQGPGCRRAFYLLVPQREPYCLQDMYTYRPKGLVHCLQVRQTCMLTAVHPYTHHVGPRERTSAPHRLRAIAKRSIPRQAKSGFCISSISCRRRPHIRIHTSNRDLSGRPSGSDGEDDGVLADHPYSTIGELEWSLTSAKGDDDGQEMGASETGNNRPAASGPSPNLPGPPASS